MFFIWSVYISHGNLEKFAEEFTKKSGPEVKVLHSFFSSKKWGYLGLLSPQILVGACITKNSCFR